MARQDRKADFFECAGKCVGKPCLVVPTAVQERLEVERRDPIILVKLVLLALGKAIGMRLAHLIVLPEFPTERVDVGHAVTAAVALSALCSRRPFHAACAMIAAA